MSLISVILEAVLLFSVLTMLWDLHRRLIILESLERRRRRVHDEAGERERGSIRAIHRARRSA